MSFSFKLQNVLDLRLRELDSAQKKWALAKKRLLEMNDELEIERNGYFKDRDDINQNKRDSVLYTLELLEVSLNQRKENMLFLLDKIQSQKTLIQKLEFTSIKLQQAIKTLEILRDKQKISFEMELSKKEKKEMDAFGTRAYVSKSNLWESEDLD